MFQKKYPQIAAMEIVLIISLTIATTYMIHATDGRQESTLNGLSDTLDKILVHMGKLFFDETTLVSALSASDLSQGVATCVSSKAGENCQEYPASECAAKCAGACVPSSRKNVAACRVGTCYDPVEGTCQAGSPQATCTQFGGQWNSDPFENIPQCREGCCVIGGQTRFVTEQQCARQSQFLGLKKEFKSDVKTELECIGIGQQQEMGACVFEREFERTCTFAAKSTCLTLRGDFRTGTLCSNPALNTTCKAQQTTGCYHDGVHWFDSCGNPENVFDYTQRIQDKESGTVLAPEKSCAVNEGGNPIARAATCGNCNYLLGSVCGKSTDKEKAAVGDFVCRDLSCIDENGKKRAHGESWCVYQGSIGVDEQANRATDTPGSRHFRNVCSRGEVRTEPCADYRNEICVESKTPVPGGTFSSAACRINRGTQCINYNTLQDKEDMKNKCEKNPDCFIKKVAVSNDFKFNVCAPKYPPGFLLSENGRGEGAEALCSLANQKCTYVKVKGLFSDKEVNKECVTEKFAEQMNDLCISLGDCGGKVNYQGEYTENYKATKSSGGIIKISQSYFNTLTLYSKRVPGKVADPGKLSDFYGDLGIPGFLGSADAPADPTAGVIKMASLTSGMMGVGLMVAVKMGVAIPGVVLGAVPAYSIPITTAGGAAAGTSAVPAVAPAMAAAGGALAGAAVGVALTGFLLQWTGVGRGLPPAVTYALLAGGAVGGALIGIGVVANAASTVTPTIAALTSIGIILVVVVIILIIIFALLGIGKVKKIDVTFQCKPWQPPTGGKECGKCGSDGLPCSGYTCQSLGQTCQFVNEGSDEEKCIDVNPNDAAAPRLTPWAGVISPQHQYSFVTDRGFSIEGPEKCIQPYTKLIFGVSLNEPGRCRVTTTHTDSFDQMDTAGIDFGLSSLFRQNHTMLVPIPDLQSLGLNGYDPNLTSTYNLYVRCEDKNGNKNTEEYAINFCIKQGPDVTPPLIVEKNPALDTVAFGTHEQNATLTTNEPATCKWDSLDTDYITMSHELMCANAIDDQTLRGWNCNAFFPVSETASETKFYVRCQDQPWLMGTANESKRNTMKESFTFVLKQSSRALAIDSITPNNGTVLRFGTEPASVEVVVATSGGLDGTAQCSYVMGTTPISFLETWSTTHRQVFQSLYAGEVTLPVQCEDLAGNKAEQTATFNVVLDSDAPRVTRVYEQTGNLIIVTDEQAQCVFSPFVSNTGGKCAYEFANGTALQTSTDGRTHQTTFSTGTTYYIKCKDAFGHLPGSDCSIIVRGRHVP